MPDKSSPQELLIPLLVIALLAVMILPLPLLVIDFLLVLNISFSLLLFLSAFYIPKPEKFTALPSLLLLSTVFRLGLNIATTRQLLANSIAPEMVLAFGNFVVNSNVVVGLVIFLIITLVQFLVITKGAERVAEVCARFTLDAMPGKQMAIDADIRSGVITIEQAKELRDDLHKESKVYGALDGAMKFIKGDTIAGIVIVFINISAGFVIGVFQKKLSILESLNRYTIFTVGDGLISQIPAILTAISAGIAVTRVSNQQGTSYSKELIQQLTTRSEGLKIVAYVLLLLGLMPGFPKLILLSLGSLIFLYSLKSKKALTSVETPAQQFLPRAVHILSIEVPKSKVRESQAKEILHVINNFKQQYYDRLGVILHDLHYDFIEDSSAVRIILNGAIIRSIDVSDDLILSLQKLLSLGIDSFASEIINDTHSRIILDSYHQTHEDLINALFPKYLSITIFTKVLKQLLFEGISIKNIPLMLQTISETLITPTYDKLHKSLPLDELLVSEIRIADKRNINSSIAKGGKINGYALNSRINKVVEKAAIAGVALHPSLLEKLSDLLANLKWNNPDEHKIILTSKIARSLLAKNLRKLFVDINFLSFEEISSDFYYQMLGEISFPEENHQKVLQNA
ncbi:MAG: FHIPEP family type III secretion protein [Proteobacteria bacterium]|nr:FHIPEP family type III secretion protein [Pseudomonadota bacterium]